MRRTWLAAMAMTAAGAAPVQAGPEVWESLGGSVNLPGLQNTLEAAWKGPRWTRGAALTLTPSQTRLQAWAQWTPTPALELRAGVEPALHHGVAGSLLGFSSREDPVDQDSRRARADARTALAGRAFFAPTLRARAGRLIASAGAEVERWRADGSAPFFYEPTRDTLLRAAGDTVLRTNVSLLHETVGRNGRRLLLGLNHRLSGPTGAWDGAHSARAGVVGSWTLRARALRLQEPTLAVNLFRYLGDPYKSGQLGLSLGLRGRIR